MILIAVGDNHGLTVFADARHHLPLTELTKLAKTHHILIETPCALRGSSPAACSNL